MSHHNVDNVEDKAELQQAEDLDVPREHHQPKFHAEDDAARVLENGVVQWTPAEERRLVLKTDLVMIPIFMVGLGILVADKNVLQSAATLTLLEDLKLSGSMYSWAVSIYYFGLLVGTYPFNVITQRFHVGRVIGIAYICWGAAILGTIGVQEYRGLFACRFLLGFFEAATVPAFTLTTARLYTPSEQPARFATWTLGNTVPPIVLLLIYYGLGQVPDHPMAPWRWFYVLLGISTVIFGIVCVFLLPDRPDNWWVYKQKERAIQVARLARTQTGIKNHRFKFHQLREGLLDPKVWIVAFMFFTQQPAPTVLGNFQSIIIKGYGYTGLTALLLTIPAYAVPSVVSPIMGWCLTHFKPLQTRKTWAMFVLSALALISEIVCYQNPPLPGVNKSLVLAFVWIMGINQSVYPLILMLVGANFAGTTKKQTAMAITYLMYCLSNIITPQAFLAREAPRYQTGLRYTLSCQSILCALSVLFYILCTMENRKRDSSTAGDILAVDDEDMISSGLADATDKENKRMRYKA